MSNVKTVYKGFLGAVEIIMNEEGEWRELDRIDPDAQTPEEWAKEHGLILSDNYIDVDTGIVQTLEQLLDGSWVTEDNDFLLYPLENADYTLDLIKSGGYVKVEENEVGDWVKV